MESRPVPAGGCGGRTEPTFSVVVPTYARPGPLRGCLEALARLDYPRERFEVLVIDDGGPAGLEAVVAPLRGRLNVTLLRLPANAGPAAARNAGAARATGRFLAFTDDDCTPRPGWLRAFAARFAAAPDHLLGGRTVNVLVDNVFAAASQDLIDYLYAYYNRVPSEARFFASNNLAMPAEAYRAIGGFDASFPPAGEDRELCHRWRDSGRAMTYVADAVVGHAHALSLHRFWCQHFTYGRGAFHLDRALRRSGRRSLGVEPLAFYLNLVGHPLRDRTRHGRVAGMALMVVSQIANAAGFFAERARGGRRSGAGGGAGGGAGAGGPGWEPAGGRALPRRPDVGRPSK